MTERSNGDAPGAAAIEHHRRCLGLLTVQLLGVLVALLACRSGPTDPGPRLPVISMTLVAGHSSHFAFVTRGSLADSSLPPYQSPEPVPDHLVQLSIAGPGGQIYPLVPDGVAGRHRAALAVLPGGTYRLEGTVEGRPVGAGTTIPSEFAVLDPAADTVRATTAPGLVVTVLIPFQFRGAEIALIEGRAVDAAGRIQGAGKLNHSGDTLQVSAFSLGVYRFELFGYNRAALDWLERPNPRGNVAGALGGFMGAISTTKVLVIE